MLINVSEGEECRIALLEDGKLEELYMERASSTSHVGNIYKGRVTNVEPSIQAAFVDFGLGRNGFLHISDLMPSYFGKKGGDVTEAVGRKMARRDRPPIQRCLRRGDEITVQIIKEGIGTKGPTLTTYLSIPGRILVMMPGMSKFGISRKIEDEEERRRLRAILDQLKPIQDVGFIIRTAGVGKTKTEIERDLKYLTRLWENIQKKMKQPAPVELYTEGDLVTRTVRDVYSSDIERIVVDNRDVARRIKEFFKIAMPRTKNKVELYEEPIPLFHKYGIEHEIEKMYSRHVPLPSGGSLVIDSTEAIVAIDVNSGKFRDHADAEMTAFKTDLEAADEIPRQLRLRDLGGVIICDFIDLRYERHRRELEKRLHENLKKDRAKTKVLRMSQFGIIEMTRQRMRPSLKRSIYFDCPHCKGSGLVKTPESMSLDVMRKLAIAVHDQRVVRVELSVCPDVAFYLLNRKRAQLANMEQQTGKRIIVHHDAQLGLDELRLQLFDSREGLVYLESLGMSPHDQYAPTVVRSAGALPAPAGRREDRRGGSGRDQRRGGSQSLRRSETAATAQPQRRDSDQAAAEAERYRAELEDQDELESAADAVEEREEVRAAAAVSGPAPALASAPTESSERDLPPPPEQHVVELDDAVEPIGEAPSAVEDEPEFGEGGGRRRRRRRRGRRGRGRNGNGGNGGAQPAMSAEESPAGQDDAAVEVESAGMRQSPQSSDEPLVEASAEPAMDPDDAPEPGNEKYPPEDSSTGAQEGEQPRRRRRRRGGRRHRRRRERAAAESQANGQSQPEAGSQASAAQTSGGIDAPAADGPRSQPREPEAGDEPSSVGGRATPQRIPPRNNEQPAKSPNDSTTPPTAPPQVVRTGSTDRHLVHTDEPVAPEPPRRPRTYRDLDTIPDDLD
ncbi:Rne/Rng family ribonuclease [Fontivita pretiosa]|uniref:Rne/Rng family ribonuclease n=1 Tax=Fontivita pretiosa TaxID=2989684 RepID=UPI003D1824BC